MKFVKNPKTKHDNNIHPREELLTRTDKIPDDYHCDCYLENYLGEIYNTDLNKYYSQLARNKYYDTTTPKHIAPGHFLGYRWAIQKFTQPGDWVFDPTVGTGTAIIEAINNDRNGIGIELEYPDITEANIKKQFERSYDPPTGRHIFINGDARCLAKYLDENNVSKESLQLVINGTPYPKEGSTSSDAPERGMASKIGHAKKAERLVDYKLNNNFGTFKGSAYWDLITNMYVDSVPYMKSGAKMVILIKDLVRNKQPYLLHKEIVDRVLEATSELKYYGTYLHRHVPETLFMRTYNKTYGDHIKVPMYQTGIVLEKV